MAAWRFLTNHGLVFLHKMIYPAATVREISVEIGVTERAVYRILRDLESDGYLTKEKTGRRAFYRVRPNMPLRHQLLQDVQVQDLLNALTRRAARRAGLPAA